MKKNKNLLLCQIFILKLKLYVNVKIRPERGWTALTWEILAAFFDHEDHEGHEEKNKLHDLQALHGV